MRYSIGCLVRGEAAEYVKTTTADLSARFGVIDVSALISPRLTVKGPFERNNAEAIEEIISLNAEVPAVSLPFSGWNHFGTRTIFIDSSAVPPELKTFLTDLLNKFRTAGVQITPSELDMHQHLSVARFLKPNQYNEIWKYLQSVPAPQFDIMFDNLTLFSQEREKDPWKTVKTFPLTGKR